MRYVPLVVIILSALIAAPLLSYVFGLSVLQIFLGLLGARFALVAITYDPAKDRVRPRQ